MKVIANADIVYTYLFSQLKDLNYPGHSRGDICSRMNEKGNNRNQQYRLFEKHEKKEEAEVQNTLTLKSGGEKVSIPSFKNMNNIANCKLISKIDKRGTIFIFTMHLS